MTKAQKDEYWMDCIQQCRISGLSDYAWCSQNGIPTSSFYYNIKRLRKKASMIPASVPKVLEKTEIVPIHYNEQRETKVVLPKKQTDSIAIVWNTVALFWLSATMQMPPLLQQH